jgi:hypothetical protein
LLLLARICSVRAGAFLGDAVIIPRELGWEEGTMKSLVSSVKHARYAMGSLTAVLFAASVGASF